MENEDLYLQEFSNKPSSWKQIDLRFRTNKISAKNKIVLLKIFKITNTTDNWAFWVLSDLVQAYMECNCSKQWTNFVKSNPSYKFWTNSQHSCRYIGMYLFVIKVEIQCKKLHACIYWACFCAHCLNLISPYFHFVKYWSESNIINIDSDFHF